MGRYQPIGELAFVTINFVKYHVCFLAPFFMGPILTGPPR